MSKLYLFISLLFISLIIYSCNENSATSSELNVPGLSGEMSGAEVNADVNRSLNLNGTYKWSEAEKQKAQARKLIKTGDIAFETDSMNKARQRILAAVDKYTGYVSSDTEAKSYNKVTNTITIRMPNENFDQVLAECVQGVAHLDRREIKVRDVTEEFLDIETRVKTKKELENRYLELLKKAHTVQDVIEVEREIGKLRVEIESAEGRLKYLANQSTFGTLIIQFYKYTEPVKKEKENRFVKGFKNGWEGLVMFMLGLVHIWPFIIIFGALIFIIVRRFRSRRTQ